MKWRIKHRLILEVKVRRKHALRTVVDAEPAFKKIKSAAHRQRCRGQNDGVDFLEKPLAQKSGNVDRRRFQKQAAPAPLPPEDTVAVLPFHNLLQHGTQLRRA